MMRMASNADVVASVNRMIAYCKNILVVKGQEYAKGDEDRLANFKRGASIAQRYTHDCSGVKEVLVGYMLKHIVSIDDMSKRPATEYSRACWDEKIGDAINYLLLLSAVVDEEWAKEDE